MYKRQGKDREAIKDAIYRITHIENGSLEKKNQVFTNYLQNGVDVSYFKDGKEKSDIVYLIDYENVSNNSFVVANQWTFIEHSNKRPDVILFINGMPLVLSLIHIL